MKYGWNPPLSDDDPQVEDWAMAKMCIENGKTRRIIDDWRLKVMQNVSRQTAAWRFPKSWEEPPVIIHWIGGSMNFCPPASLWLCSGRSKDLRSVAQMVIQVTMGRSWEKRRLSKGSSSLNWWKFVCFSGFSWFFRAMIIGIFVGNIMGIWYDMVGSYSLVPPIRTFDDFPPGLTTGSGTAHGAPQWCECWFLDLASS